MLRGTKTFVCDNCGHKFKGGDFEWNCTVFSAPLKCPKCGSFHTYPYSSSEGFFGRIFGGGSDKSMYEDIWKMIDKQQKENKNE